MILKKQYLSLRDIYRVEKTIPHLRLIDWHDENYFFVKKFVESLKQGGPSFIFKKMGLEMFSRFVHRFPQFQNKKINFVPAPRSNTYKKDHAYLFAQTLSYYFGGILQPILYKRKKHLFQKSKSRKERALIQFETSKHLNLEEPIVFVDDVLTTGCTARSAYKALKKPKHFFIFTLAWTRPPPEEDL